MKVHVTHNILALGALFIALCLTPNQALQAVSENTTSTASQLVFLQEDPGQSAVVIIDSDTQQILKKISLESYNSVGNISVAGKYLAFTSKFGTKAYLLDLESNIFRSLDFIDPPVGVIEGLALASDGQSIAWSTSQLSYLGWLESKLFVSDLDGRDVQNMILESYQYIRNPAQAYAMIPLQWVDDNSRLYYQKFVFDNGPTRKAFPCFQQLYAVSLADKTSTKVLDESQCPLVSTAEFDGLEYVGQTMGILYQDAKDQVQDQSAVKGDAPLLVELDALKPFLSEENGNQLQTGLFTQDSMAVAQMSDDELFISEMLVQLGGKQSRVIVDSRFINSVHSAELNACELISDQSVAPQDLVSCANQLSQSMIFTPPRIL